MDINEHDITKKMINTIKGRETKNSISNGENLNEDDVSRSMLKTIRENSLYGKDNNDDTIQLSGDELKEEQDKFRELVGTNRVEFTIFNIYPEANNVIFGGKFQNIDGLGFQLSLEGGDGIYVTANNIKLTDEALTILQKLRAFYVDWADEWAKKLATEYKNV